MTTTTPPSRTNHPIAAMTVTAICVPVDATPEPTTSVTLPTGDPAYQVDCKMENGKWKCKFLSSWFILNTGDNVERYFVYSYQILLSTADHYMALTE